MRGILIFLAWVFFPGSVYATSAGGLHPVLFVHGSGLSAALWNDMIAALQSHGYPAAYLKAVDMLPRDGSNPVAARRYIAPAVQQLLAAARSHARKAGWPLPDKVDVVAHSMGAVSSRWFIAMHNPEWVRRWIGVVPANHGTDALCGYSGRGDRELCPAFARTRRQSEVQIRLNGLPGSPRDETPYGVGRDEGDIVRVPPDDRRSIAYYTLRIDPDEWIVPADSAILDGAGGLVLREEDWSGFLETSAGNFLFTDNVGHDDVPRDPRVAAWVAAVLSAPLAVP